MPATTIGGYVLDDPIAPDSDRVVCHARKLMGGNAILCIWRVPRQVKAAQDSLAAIQEILAERGVEAGQWNLSLYLAADSFEQIDAALPILRERGLFPGEWNIPSAGTLLPSTHKEQADGRGTLRFRLAGILVIALLFSVAWLFYPDCCARPKLRVGLYRWPGSLGGANLPDDRYSVVWLDDEEKLFDPHEYDVIALPFGDAESRLARVKASWKVIGSPESANGSEHVLIHQDLEDKPSKTKVVVYTDGDWEAVDTAELFRYWKGWIRDASALHRILGDLLLRKLLGDGNREENAIVAMHDPYASLLEKNRKFKDIRDLNFDMPADASALLLASGQTLQDKMADLVALTAHWNSRRDLIKDLSLEPDEKDIVKATGLFFSLSFSVRLDDRGIKRTVRETELRDEFTQAGFVYRIGSTECAERGRKICDLIDSSVFEENVRRSGPLELKEGQARLLCESDQATLNSLVTLDTFRPGKAAIAEIPEDRMKNLSGWAAPAGDDLFCVVGHADETGDSEANYKLGLERASSVIDYLNRFKPGAHRLVGASRGNRDAGKPSWDEKTWDEKRRVEIRRLRVAVRLQ